MASLLCNYRLSSLVLESWIMNSREGETKSPMILERPCWTTFNFISIWFFIFSLFSACISIHPSIQPIHFSILLIWTLPSSIYPSVYSFVSSTLPSIHVLTYRIHESIHAPTQKLICLSIYPPIIYPSTHPYTYPLSYLLLHSSVHPLIHSNTNTHSSIHPFIHLCTHPSIQQCIPLTYTLTCDTFTYPPTHMHLLSSPLDWARGPFLKRQTRGKWTQVSKACSYK